MLGGTGIMATWAHLFIFFSLSTPHIHKHKTNCAKDEQQGGKEAKEAVQDEGQKEGQQTTGLGEYL